MIDGSSMASRVVAVRPVLMNVTEMRRSAEEELAYSTKGRAAETNFNETDYCFPLRPSS